MVISKEVESDILVFIENDMDYGDDVAWAINLNEGIAVKYGVRVDDDDMMHVNYGYILGHAAIRINDGMLEMFFDNRWSNTDLPEEIKEAWKEHQWETEGENIVLGADDEDND